MRRFMKPGRGPGRWYAFPLIRWRCRLDGHDPDCFLPPLTAYSVMRLGKVSCFHPISGEANPAMGEAVRSLAGKIGDAGQSSGPVVAGLELEAAVFAMKELEETAKLAMMLRGLKPNLLTDLHISDLKTHFNIDWD